MFNPLQLVDSADAGASAANIGDYGERLEACLSLLATGCGLSPEGELRRFQQWQEILNAGGAPGASGTGGPSGLVQSLASSLTQTLPTVFELALVYKDGGPKGFGYLTQGRPAASLPQSLGELLRSGLHMYLGHGGSAGDAQLLTEIFTLAFPDLPALSPFSPMAQGMIVGLVPTPKTLHAKVYFNTRINPGSGHEQQVVSMLQHLGVNAAPDPRTLYRTLYNEGLGARFQGVGVDLDGRPNPRGKIYVRVDTAHWTTLATEVAEVIGMNPLDFAPLTDAFSEDILANEVEVGCGLTADASPTLKVTLFFPPKSATQDVTERVADHLRRVGYDPSLFQTAARALESQHGGAALAKSPVHGVGLEFPETSPPKANIYMQPVL